MLLPLTGGSHTIPFLLPRARPIRLGSSLPNPAIPIPQSIPSPSSRRPARCPLPPPPRLSYSCPSRLRHRSHRPAAVASYDSACLRQGEVATLEAVAVVREETIPPPRG
ncbi:hypothetical protein ABZP36_029307 [Zizania latifolia]